MSVKYHREDEEHVNQKEAGKHESLQPPGNHDMVAEQLLLSQKHFGLQRVPPHQIQHEEVQDLRGKKQTQFGRGKQRPGLKDGKEAKDDATKETSWI